MKREYFAGLFILVITGLWFALDYYFGGEKLMKFIVVWVLIGFQVGQYSMRFPKAF